MADNFYSQIVKEANKFAKAGVRYKHRGMTINGCDCTGLLVGLLRNLGFFKTFRLRNYSIDWNLHSGSGEYIISGLVRIGNEILKTETEPGDVLIFRFGRCNAHIGIMVEQGLFVHSHLDARKCKYAKLENSNWFYRWTKTYRLDQKKLLSNYGK